jgi:hypothetical protein
MFAREAGQLGYRVQDFRRPLRVEPDGIHIDDRDRLARGGQDQRRRV